MVRAFSKIFALLILTSCFGRPMAAGPVEDAALALSRGDYATGLRIIRPLAEQGDARAQYNLGVSYDQGWGVRQDAAEAVKWYRLSAGQGYSLAQQNLGDIYASGRGMPQ